MAKQRVSRAKRAMARARRRAPAPVRVPGPASPLRPRVARPSWRRPARWPRPRRSRRRPTPRAAPAPVEAAPPSPVPTVAPAPAPAESSPEPTLFELNSNAWAPLNEPGSGGRISSLAVSPYDSRRVLVGGDMLGVGLSTDSGAHWLPTKGFSSWEINDFTWHPSNPDVVWVGTLSGPYRSEDGGATWTSKRAGMPTGDYPYSAPVQKVLIDRTSPSHLIAIGGNQRELKQPKTGALNYGAVYESTDRGDSWRTIGSVGQDVNVLDATASAGLRTIYAATRTLGMVKSADYGRTWAPATRGLPHTQVRGVPWTRRLLSIAWAALGRGPKGPNGAYTTGGVYRTTDGGDTWVGANTRAGPSSRARTSARSRRCSPCCGPRTARSTPPTRATRASHDSSRRTEDRPGAP